MEVDTIKWKLEGWEALKEYSVIDIIVKQLVYLDDKRMGMLEYRECYRAGDPREDLHITAYSKDGVFDGEIEIDIGMNYYSYTRDEFAALVNTGTLEKPQ